MCCPPLTPSQGIKFYDPEIVENTPEAVEYRGLQNVLDAVAEHLGHTEGKVCVCLDGWLPTELGKGGRDSARLCHLGRANTHPVLAQRGHLRSDCCRLLVLPFVCVCVPPQALLAPDSTAAARWGALDDVVMVGGVQAEHHKQQSWRQR